MRCHGNGKQRKAKTAIQRQYKINAPLVGLIIICIILLNEKFLQFDWLRAVVFQLNLKYLHVKITNLLRRKNK